ncbi:MAG: ABC transporter substrate-binding protein [Thermomicrobiales bacterium]
MRDQSQLRDGRRFARRSLVKGAAAMAAAPFVFSRTAPIVRARQDAPSGDVRMWVYPLAGDDQAANEQAWEGIVSGFNAQFPDVEVTVEVQPWQNRNEQLTTALAAGAGPDVAYLNEDFIPQHAEDGNIEPLDDVIAEDRDDFLENAVAGVSYQDTLFAAPILMTATTMVYNTKLFTDAGVETFPTTWQELLDVAPTFKEQGIDLTYYSGSLESSLNLNYYPLLWQAGGQVLNEDGTAAAFNSPEGIEALNFVVSLFENGYTDESSGVTSPEPGRSPLDLGEAAVGLTVDQAWALRLAELWGEGVLQVGQPPMNKVQTSYGTAAGFALFADAGDKDASKAWIKHLVSPETMPTILGLGGYFAPRASLGSLYADVPVVGEYEQMLPLVRGGVRHRSARQIISTVAPEIQAAFLGDKSAEDALAAAEEDVNALLERNR